MLHGVRDILAVSDEPELTKRNGDVMAARAAWGYGTL
jgi:hypothetical protein